MSMVNLHLETAVIQTQYGNRHHQCTPQTLNHHLHYHPHYGLHRLKPWCPHRRPLPSHVQPLRREAVPETLLAGELLLRSPSANAEISSSASFRTVSCHLCAGSTTVRHPRCTAGCWFIESAVIPAENCATIPCRIGMTVEAEGRSYDRYAA